METFWSERRSIQLSRGLVIFFGALLVALDIGGWWFAQFICANVVRHTGMRYVLSLLICLYLCSVPAYILLVSLYKLLNNMEKDHVFVQENVVLLRRVSWCCVAAALVCLLFISTWLSLVVISLAAAFMALIVRVIKNVFVRAINMKAELDYTI